MSIKSNDISDLLVQIARRIPDVIVVGGIACQAHGSDRLTEDLDLIPAIDPDRWGRTILALRDQGFRPSGELSWDHLADGPEKVLVFLRLRDERWTLRFIHEATGLTLDLLVGYGHRYDLYAAAAVRPVIDGVTIQIAAIDDLIALKREAAENPARRAKDLSDIETLERLQHEGR